MLEVHDPAAQQTTFRAVLDAMARPGLRVEVGDPAWLAVLAALCDPAVTLADPDKLVPDAEWPFLQAVPAEAGQADFVLMRGDAPPADLAPQLGTLSEPEHGATLVLTGVEQGPTQLDLSGPGVPGTRRIGLAGLHADWLARRREWTGAFPTGVDLLLCGATSVIAIPRSTRVREA